MAFLSKLSPGDTADADVVAGSSGTPGNDNKLKTHLAAIALRHKSARWSNYTSTQRVFNLVRAAPSPTIYYGRPNTYSGSTCHGMWLKHAALYIQSCADVVVAATNSVTVRMYKTAARSYASLGHTLSDELTTVDLVKEFTIPTISGVHDDRHIVFPIASDYIAPGEYWAVEFTSGNTGDGIKEGYLVLQFAELHTE